MSASHSYRFTAVRPDFTAGHPQRRRRRAVRNENDMSITSQSPFTEIRATERQATLFVIATSAVAACGTVVAGMLVALGVAA
jgi:hypothetical protein